MSTESSQVTIHIRVDTDLHRAVKALAERNERSVNATIVRILRSAVQGTEDSGIANQTGDQS